MYAPLILYNDSDSNTESLSEELRYSIRTAKVAQATNREYSACFSQIEYDSLQESRV